MPILDILFSVSLRKKLRFITLYFKEELLQQVVNLLSYLHKYHLGVGTDFLCLLSQLTDLLVKLCLLHLPALVDLCEYLFYLAHELLVCTILRRDNSENTGERKVNLVVRLEEGHHICFPVVIIEGGD